MLGLGNRFKKTLVPFLSKLEGQRLVSRETGTSENSSIASGKCPELHVCGLIALLDFKGLLWSQNESTWPRLKVLRLSNHDRHHQGDEPSFGKGINVSGILVEASQEK